MTKNTVNVSPQWGRAGVYNPDTGGFQEFTIPDAEDWVDGGDNDVAFATAGPDDLPVRYVATYSELFEWLLDLEVGP